jgi:hypothetical protein
MSRRPVGIAILAVAAIAVTAVGAGALIGRLPDDGRAPADATAAGGSPSPERASPSSGSERPSGPPGGSAAPGEGEPATLLAVGDVASCDRSTDEAVAQLAAGSDGTVALLGDIAYPSGREGDFRDCFAPAWGSLGDRLRPVPGNHEYLSDAAAPYFAYFGAQAATPGEGWYAYELGSWRIYALNSNCDQIGGCGQGSPQLAWLVSDLAEHPHRCTLAYWHHPRFSSGRHGDASSMRDVWDVLDAAGADVVLAGHDHTYERFGPLDADGAARADGIRSFVVGTGGRSHYDFEHPRAGWEARDNRQFGLLRLTLSRDGYAWRFLSTDSATVVDSGQASCR